MFSHSETVARLCFLIFAAQTGDCNTEISSLLAKTLCVVISFMLK